MSKFSLDVLNTCVYPFLKAHDPDVILGAVFGEDVALTRVGDDILVSHLDPIVGAVKNIGWLAVHVACNDIATSGAPPRWILPLVLVPHPEHVEAASQSLVEKGIAFANVGQVIKGIGVQIINNGQIANYQEIHCEADELARMWELYPQDGAHDLDITTS